MGTGNIDKQFDNAVDKVYKEMYYYIISQMIGFGISMVNDVLPRQAGFGNLTGNTISSYAFGVYYLGKLVVMGFNKKSEPPIRNKLIKGETVTNFEDYDGNIRDWFTANVQTDGGYGTNSSMRFLQSYTTTRKFAIVFTTGTEYSEYLENLRDLNVLTQGKEHAITAFVRSFKPIR